MQIFGEGVHVVLMWSHFKYDNMAVVSDSFFVSIALFFSYVRVLCG